MRNSTVLATGILALASVLSGFAEIKVLNGLLPICASCKNIHDGNGHWEKIESYVQRHSDAEFSHGICPECIRLLYPEYAHAMGTSQG